MDEPVQPLKQILLFQEPTYEGLVKYLETDQPSVGLFSDEGAGFLGRIWRHYHPVYKSQNTVQSKGFQKILKWA